MNRRHFIAVCAGLGTSSCLAHNTPGPSEREGARDRLLREHKIRQLTLDRVVMKYPRLVGRNSRGGVHGRGPTVTVCLLETDKGATGWGQWRGGSKLKTVQEQVIGKRMTELFNPRTGIMSKDAARIDFALHDLAGQILDLPVYKMLGDQGTKSTPCYSGMIYFDELEPVEKPRPKTMAAGIDAVLENCRADYNLGYRQLKVKIGRGNKWMEKDAGLKRDIEVTKQIAKRFSDIDILVDANDGYDIDTCIAYLEGIGDIELFWIEEPFRETVEDYAKLRSYLERRKHKTLLADGEARPDWDVLAAMTKNNLLDVQLVDIVGLGFTAWRRLMPQLKKQGVQASPHAWGNALKTNYAAHIAAGLGNVVTVEGVTCRTDDVDMSGYRLKDGKITVPDAPGFGMKLTRS